MKAYYLLAPLGVVALIGCTINPPPAPVAYVTPPPTVVMGGPATAVDSDGDGYSNAVDSHPYDARFH